MDIVQKGAYMLLDEASVTGTANILMSAVLTLGKTTIFNAACEPYLQQLCKMLVSMGARINGVGSNLLTIEGIDSLNGCEHTILPDMIEIGSFIGLAAMTNSDITIKNVSYQNLGIIPDAFRRMGIKFDLINDDIHIPAQDHYEIDTFIDGSILTIADARRVVDRAVGAGLANGRQGEQYGEEGGEQSCHGETFIIEGDIVSVVYSTILDLWQFRFSLIL